MSVVIADKKKGIYLGSGMGLGFWSKLDAVGQESAVTFPSKKEAEDYLQQWPSDAQPLDVQLVSVSTAQEGYASAQELKNAGLTPLLGEMAQYVSHDEPLKYASAVESDIAHRLVDDFLRAGYSIEVNDGEETAIEASRDRSAILAELCATGQDILIIHEDGEKLGVVHLVYGNDEDLISDYSGFGEIERILDDAIEETYDEGPQM